MERKNSQQSQHGKQESTMPSGGGEIGRVNMEWECDPSVLELIGGDTEIRVKIADLGNACYNVSITGTSQTFSIWMGKFIGNVNLN